MANSQPNDEHPARKYSQEQINRHMSYLWLHYFNNTLFAQGPITESERNRMAILIKLKYPPINPMIKDE